jgi:hypothetical protein
MEISCQRCHQTVQADNTFCPTCGLPQLVYTAEAANTPGQPDRWNEVVRDASTVDWKPAIRAAIVFAVPAGLLSSGVSPLSLFGLFWMAAAAAWAVVLYVRGQSPAWITIGAGARIGFVTGIMAVWLAFTLSGSAMFVERYFLHRSAQIDNEWRESVDASQQLTAQLFAQMGISDTTQVQARRAWMLSPWGHAGNLALGLAGYSIFLLFFAVSGGALGARLLARVRRPQL